MEAKFFSKGIWATLKPSQLGVGALRTRLSNVLRDQILGQLPSVLEDVQNGLDDCQARIEKLGAPRATLAEQRRYLVRASEAFSNLVKAAVNGEYIHAFFGDPSTVPASRNACALWCRNACPIFRITCIRGARRGGSSSKGPCRLEASLDPTI
jgi:hypothetical protein